MQLKRCLVVVTGIVALLILLPATGASAGAAHSSVQTLDDCDPATFNAVLGPGSCAKNGGTTFDEFVAQVQAQGRASAWRFAPGHLKVDAGGTITARNRGGEEHTFTPVANFGGGCIAALNDLLGLTPVPECAGFPGGAFGATLAPPGGTVTTAPLTPGIHRYECLVHPWMRTTVTVR